MTEQTPRPAPYIRVPIPHLVLERRLGPSADVRQEAASGPLLLVFMGLTPVEGIVEKVRSWRRAIPSVRILIVSAATGIELPEVPELDLLVDPDGDGAWAFGCSSVPSGVILGSDNLVAGGPVEGLDGIDALVERARAQLSPDDLQDAGVGASPAAGSNPLSSELAAGTHHPVGVFTPTFDRPDLARSLVLQMNNQTVRPDFLVIHQNGQPESYQWAIEDIDTPIEVIWLHSPGVLAQDEWYHRPLGVLLDLGCRSFFWCDHDDIYFAHHIATGLRGLDRGNDFIVNERCAMLLLKKSGHQYLPDIEFKAHDPGGHSSSMCFNRAFAEALVNDLRANQGRLAFSDQVVNRVTKPRFASHIERHSLTTAYVCHERTVSSSHWLAE